MAASRKLAVGQENLEVDVETRHRIIEAARELFNTKGYKGVSMREVAEVVRVTPAALYYHFPEGKEDLFLAVLKQMFDEQARAISEAVTPGQNIREKLRLLSVQIISGLLRNSSWPMLMRDVHEHLPENKHQIWENYGASYFHAIRNVFQEGIDNGELSGSISPEILSNMFYGMTASSNWHPRLRESLHDPVEVGRIADIIVTTLLDGIALKKR